MICPQCGSSTPDDQPSCATCGTVLPAAPSAFEPPAEAAGSASAWHAGTPIVHPVPDQAPSPFAPGVGDDDAPATELATPAVTAAAIDDEGAYLPPGTAPAAAYGAYVAGGADPAWAGDEAPAQGDPGPEHSGSRRALVAGGIAAGIVVLLLLAFLFTRGGDNGPTLIAGSTLPATTSTTAARTTGSATTGTRDPRTGSPTTIGGTPTSTASGASTTTTARVATSTTATTAATSTTTAKAGPTITTFSAPATVPAGPCKNQGNTEIVLTWATTGAASVTVGVDSPDPFQQNLPPTGDLAVPFACPGGAAVSHTYYLTAFSADGTRSTQSTTVRFSG